MRALYLLGNDGKAHRCRDPETGRWEACFGLRAWLQRHEQFCRQIEALR